MTKSAKEREIAAILTETKAVDFEAIGRAFAQIGPSAFSEVDYEPVFCGTMRYYIHLYRLPTYLPDGPADPGVQLAE
jgi:hypothetical protein